MRRFEAKFLRLSGSGSGIRWALPGLILAVAIAGLAQEGGKPPQAVKPNAPLAVAEAQMANGDVQPKASAPENPRQKQIADESAQLLAMALALKAEVDKTTKDTLSLNVIKKADEIEKLAKAVKEKMKQNSGS